MNEGKGGEVWILLFTVVTLFEYNVSTILTRIVAYFHKNLQVTYLLQIHFNIRSFLSMKLITMIFFSP